MKPEEFKKIIRGLIQEELNKQLPLLIPQVLTEILSGKSKPTISEKSMVNVDHKLPTSAIPQPKVFKKYVNDPRLNAVLNETVVKIKPDTDSFVGYSEPMHSTVNGNINIQNEENVKFSDLNETFDPVVADIQPVNEQQAKVLGKLNRDFRSLMHAVDQKKKSGVNPFGGGVTFE